MALAANRIQRFPSQCLARLPPRHTPLQRTALDSQHRRWLAARVIGVSQRPYSDPGGDPLSGDSLPTPGGGEPKQAGEE
jgi:hypothetical protein